MLPCRLSFSLFFALLMWTHHAHGWMPQSQQRSTEAVSIRRIKLPRRTVPRLAASEDDSVEDDARRRLLSTKRSVVRVASASILAAAVAVWTKPAWAASKSRTDGYPVQKTESEWKQELSPLQYSILRQGGTERPFFSILEKEKRNGVFRCAGCDTPLFDSNDKFDSGTGWPSFARGLPGVEVETVNPITASLAGAELRCKSCGGHLGDVFNDGFLFVGSEAAKTGKRYCIDGAALVFYPEGSGDKGSGNTSLSSSSSAGILASAVRGDLPQKQASASPSWLEPPKVIPRDGGSDV